MPEEQPRGREGTVIFINDARFVAPSRTMTGREIKQLAAIPEGNRLFREEPGRHADTPIGDDEVVELRDGNKFYDLPPVVKGGRR
jgi:hypothetical protein